MSNNKQGNYLSNWLFYTLKILQTFPPTCYCHKYEHLLFNTIVILNIVCINGVLLSEPKTELAQ